MLSLMDRAGDTVPVGEPTAGQVKVSLKAGSVTFEDIRSVSIVDVHCLIFVVVLLELLLT
jgi:hypothetical protein